MLIKDIFIIIRAVLDAAALNHTPSKPKRARMMTEKARLLDEETKEMHHSSAVSHITKIKQENINDR